jgi:hypothetical protein
MPSPKKPKAPVPMGPARAVAGTKSKVRAKTGTTTYKAKAKPRPTAKPKGSDNPLGQIGEALDKIIPTRKWKHPVVPKPRREVNVPTIVNKALGK